MTNRLASRLVSFAAAFGLAGALATSVGAQNLPPTSVLTPAVEPVPSMMALFFDFESAELTSEAKTIVRRTIDAAKRGQAKEIAIFAYAAPDESVRDPELAAERAAAVKHQIAVFGFQGRVVIDEKAPRVVVSGDEVVQRRAILHFGRPFII
jgi:hypothetical protein